MGASGRGANYQNKAYLDDILGQTESPPQQKKPVVYPLMWDDQLDAVANVAWLVHGVLPARALSILYGPPGKGKTFLGLDWALSIANGYQWHDREVMQGPVVYVCAEGWNGVKDRVKAWKQNNDLFGDDRSGVAFLGRPIRLLDPGDVIAFGDSIEASGVIPALIVVDTLSRNAAGLDENSAPDMGAIVGACDALRVRFDSAVLLVHHPTKGGLSTPTLRGHGSLNGAADMVALFKPAEDGTLLLICDKMKDHAEFHTMKFRLAPVGNSVVLVAEGKDAKKPKQDELDFPT